MTRTLITGGARSGKSLAAEQLVEPFSSVRYVATSKRDPQDLEWEARIALHAARRPESWHTVETTELADELRFAESGTAVLIDCLTLWVARILFPDEGSQPEQGSAQWEQKMTELAQAVRSSSAEVVLVTNEVGSGIVPDSPQTRAYRDALGALNAAVAAVCDRVVLYVAGCPLIVKDQ